MTFAGEPVLREVVDADLPVFCEQQLDASAVHMAAFTARDPGDRAAFDGHWSRIRADPSVTLRTIEVVGQAAGHVAVYGPPTQREVTYWIGRPFWGRGIASRALASFLRGLKERPLFARAAKDNLASIRVLEKCGFERFGDDAGFARGRGQVIEEVLLTLKH